VLRAARRWCGHCRHQRRCRSRSAGAASIPALPLAQAAPLGAVFPRVQAARLLPSLMPQQHLALPLALLRVRRTCCKPVNPTGTKSRRHWLVPRAS
jgi:hypothetical protein